MPAVGLRLDLIPAELRERLEVKPGSTVTITIDHAGRIVVEPRSAAVRVAQR